MVALDFADELEFSEGDGLEIVDQIDWVGLGAAEPVLLDVPTRENLVVRALRARGTNGARPPREADSAGGGSRGRFGGRRRVPFAGRASGIPSLASRLGADVPFCLSGGHAIVRGVGEIVEALAPVEMTVLLLTPSFGVSTAAVYKAFDEVGAPERGASRNDLERAALVVEPRLGRFLDLFAELAGERSTLAGSGATWFLECDPRGASAMASSSRPRSHPRGCAAVVKVAHATA